MDGLRITGTLQEVMGIYCATCRKAIHSTRHAQNPYFTRSYLYVPGTAMRIPKVVPSIRLSPDEVTKAKNFTQSLRDAEERNKKARLAFEEFRQSYQTAHPELSGIKFTDDFRLAVSRVGSPATGVLQVASIELTAEEHKKLESLDRKSTRLNSSHSGESRMPSSA